MKYITQISDRHTQTSVNLEANHRTGLQFFTQSNAFSCSSELNQASKYLLKKLLTNLHLKALVLYRNSDVLQHFIPLLQPKISLWTDSRSPRQCFTYIIWYLTNQLMN